MGYHARKYAEAALGIDADIWIKLQVKYKTRKVQSDDSLVPEGT